MNLHLSLGGNFTFQVGKEVLGKDITTQPILRFKNMILDSGLKRIGQYSDYANYIHLGSGNAPPVPAQTALQNRLYSGNTISPINGWRDGVNSDNPDKPYVWFKRTWRVPPQGVARTYAEVGVGWNDTELTSRTLIKDPVGLPTTISIADDEYIDITWEFRVYIPTTTRTLTIIPDKDSDDKIPRDVTTRACNAGTNSISTGWALRYGTSPISILYLWTSKQSYFRTGVIQDIYKSPLGNTIGSGFNFSIAERVSDTSARLKISRGLPDNVGLIRSLVLNSILFSYQFQFDPPFNKTNEDKFELEFLISWGRYEDVA